MKAHGIVIACILGLACFPCQAEQATAHYIANEGVMIVRGETRVLFDPLFKNSYGHYTLPPAEMREAIITGSPPYDGVDAVFISHYHGDHFSPEDILSLLKAQPGLRLFAPNQAIDGLRKAAKEEDTPVFTRVNSIRLQYRDKPVTLEMGGLQIDAVAIPHSGWPDHQLDIENIVFRVTLDDDVTVLHLGDADPNDVHFSRDTKLWDSRQLDLALPPYWFFGTPGGRAVLTDRLRAAHSIGIHVPERMPDERASRPPELREFDLFTEPGESRTIGNGQPQASEN